MECSTVSCDVDDYATLLNSTNRKARKQHKCCECRKVISIDETYLEERTAYDGTVEVWKTCLDCVQIREEFFKDGFFYGETKELLAEHIFYSRGEISESCIARLRPGAREYVLRMVEECFNDDDEEDVC